MCISGVWDYGYGGNWWEIDDVVGVEFFDCEGICCGNYFGGGILVGMDEVVLVMNIFVVFGFFWILVDWFLSCDGIYGFVCFVLYFE